jgi:outer membrane protein TolC
MISRIRFILCAWLAVTGARAAEPLQLTLEDCLRRGLERSSAMVNARMDVERAEWTIGEIRAQALPNLSARSSVTQYEEIVPQMGASGVSGRDTLLGASAEVRQLLFSGGSVKAALSAAGLYRDLSSTRSAVQEAALRRDITIRFYAVLLADEAVRIRRDSIAQLESLATQAQTKFRGETASEYDVLTAQVQLANERPLLTDTLRNRELVREGFRNLIRLDSEAFELLVPDTPPPPLPDLDRLLRAGRMHQPAIQAAALQVNLLTQDILNARGGYFPELYARAGYGGTNPPFVGSEEDAWNWGWNAGINLEWSLWDGDRRRSIIRNKDLERSQAIETLGETERDTALAIRQAWLRMQHATETYRASAETVTLAEKGLAIARTRFDAGIATPLDFNDSNLALNTARFNRLQALLAIRAALADLEQAAGLKESEFHGEELKDENASRHP